ncbi:serine/threonine-protein kinase [Streptomyces sp. NPDC046939]|uniref:serine/threonine-protein kinase n=1 Tax=Streptomyces sp. NPDC046939 TaxID=3155376 RepID=UPI0033F0D39C
MGTEGANVRVIGGRYRLEAEIGRGGMGVIWRSTDTLLARQVAVKELGLDESLSEGEARLQREQMLREARAVAQLRHPNIIVVHDVVLDDGRPYMVMELVEGPSLAERLAQDGPVDALHAARIGLALLGALRVAHAGGVQHRDLKPANVLLESDTGRIVLTDFGIARVAGATTLTESGGFVGSPEYTAPERMQGGRTGPAADLWSLGALLCAALSGESPFRRDSLGGILHAVLYEEALPPAEAAPLLPVVRGLLEREPERRLDVDEAERLLRAYVATGATPQAAQARLPFLPPPLDTVVVRRRRIPTRVVLVAAAVVAAVTGAGISAAVLLARQDGDGQPPTSTAGPTRTETTTQAPTPTVTVTRAPTRTGQPPVTAPPGYRGVRDAKGFALAVPKGFSRSVDGPWVYYLSADRTFRIGVRVSAPQNGGPAATQQRAAAAGPRTNPGYRDGKITDTSHDAHDAALWEFTWDDPTSGGQARRVMDLCWEEGGRRYDIRVSAPVGRADEARGYFDAAVDTFAPPAGQ